MTFGFVKLKKKIMLIKAKIVKENQTHSIMFIESKFFMVDDF